LADVIGWKSTLLMVVATGFAGASLARRQGLSTYVRIQEELAAGRMPTDALLDAALIFVAGAMLLTPGVLTDLLGFSLLLPPSRRVFRNWLTHWVRTRFRVQTFTPHGFEGEKARDQIIDSYVVRDRSAAADEPRSSTESDE
jgi:UPF0716 protein FxsA